MDLSLFGFTIDAVFVRHVIRVALIVGIGFPIVKLVSRFAGRAMERVGSAHVRMIVSKAVFYSGILLLIFMLLSEFGFNLSALLGAAGIFGVAIGFAAQTSMSNLISGLFILSEQFLVVNDDISCSGISGVITTIDLFSVKVKTYDGQLVRIPNEKLIKENLTNITYYPSRRAEIMIGVSGDTSLETLTALIDEVVKNNKLVVDKPAHTLVLNSLSHHAKHVTVRVWAEHKNFFAMKQALVQQLYDRCAHDNIQTIFISQGR